MKNKKLLTGALVLALDFGMTAPSLAKGNTSIGNALTAESKDEKSLDDLQKDVNEAEAKYKEKVEEREKKEEAVQNAEVNLKAKEAVLAEKQWYLDYAKAAADKAQARVNIEQKNVKKCIRALAYKQIEYNGIPSEDEEKRERARLAIQKAENSLRYANDALAEANKAFDSANEEVAKAETDVTEANTKVKEAENAFNEAKTALENAKEEVESAKTARNNAIDALAKAQDEEAKKKTTITIIAGEKTRKYTYTGADKDEVMEKISEKIAELTEKYGEPTYSEDKTTITFKTGDKTEEKGKVIAYVDDKKVLETTGDTLVEAIHKALPDLEKFQEKYGDPEIEKKGNTYMYTFKTRKIPWKPIEPIEPEDHGSPLIPLEPSKPFDDDDYIIDTNSPSSHTDHEKVDLLKKLKLAKKDLEIRRQALIYIKKLAPKYVKKTQKQYDKLVKLVDNSIEKVEKSIIALEN